MMKENSRQSRACPDGKKAKIKESKKLTSLRRQSQVCKVFECKIVEKRLNKKQREQLEMLFVEGKWFYNHVINLHQERQIRLLDINTTNIKSVNHFTKDHELIVSELEYLSAAQKQAILARMVSNQRAIISLVRKGVQKHGNLQFKSELNCIPLKQYGQTYSFKSFNKVKIQGISGTVLVRTGNQLQIADELANANLVKKPDGYYLKVTAFINKENWKAIQINGKEIGLDFGIKTNITTSESEKLDVSVEESDRLKKLQRKQFRQVKGSNNRYKTIKKIQREYQKLSNKKQDKANKIVSKLKRYETIVIQDEQISNWHTSYGKTVQHSCMGIIKKKLNQLPQTIILDKWIPTTKWCPRCGTINKYITLNDRIYKCGCGYESDRDIHSANNMITIKNLILTNISIPMERRELTLEEFKTAVEDSNVFNKSER